MAKSIQIFLAWTFSEVWQFRQYLKQTSNSRSSCSVLGHWNAPLLSRLYSSIYPIPGIVQCFDAACTPATKQEQAVLAEIPAILLGHDSSQSIYPSAQVRISTGCIVFFNPAQIDHSCCSERRIAVMASASAPAGKVISASRNRIWILSLAESGLSSSTSRGDSLLAPAMRSFRSQ